MMKRVNNIKRGPLANCIALHDFAVIPENIRDFVHYIFDFFRKSGIEPTRMSSQKTDKTVSVKIGIKQLEEKRYETNSMWIGSTPPRHNSDMFSSIFSASFSYKFGTTFILCFDNDILGFTPHIIEPLTKDLSEFFGSQYGYAYQRKFSQGPIFYPYGVHGGNERDSEEERKKITRWNHIYRMPDGSYKLGDLRDIYSYNFLSKLHLERDVFGTTMKEWVESDLSRGMLTKITDTLWSWHLDPDYIQPVRSALSTTGFLICV